MEKENKIILTNEEYDEIKQQLISFSDYQRLSSVLIWIGITTIILHILADILFHTVSR